MEKGLDHGWREATGEGLDQDPEGLEDPKEPPVGGPDMVEDVREGHGLGEGVDFFTFQSLGRSASIQPFVVFSGGPRHSFRKTQFPESPGP